jgi:hypothetical protein
MVHRKSIQLPAEPYYCTTIAELFIGFLVAAAANRSERNLELTLAAIAEQDEHIEDVQAKLTSQIHVLLTAASQVS